MKGLTFDTVIKNNKKIIIWGTIIAGDIVDSICRNYGLEVVAYCDNNKNKWGSLQNGVEILSPDDAKKMYADAIVILSVFSLKTEIAVTQQLNRMGYKYVTFRDIEYWYEINVLKRKMEDRTKLYQIMNYVDIDEDTPWRMKIDRKVVEAYQYIVTEEDCSDLEEKLSELNGVKNLQLVIDLNEVTLEQVKRFNKIKEKYCVGHIIIKTCISQKISISIVDELNKFVFYWIISTNSNKEYVAQLEKHVDIYRYGSIPDKRALKKTDKEKKLTEQLIVNTFCSYLEIEQKEKYDDKTETVIVQIFNGLANQMLMYLFGRFLEQYSGKNVIFDDTIIFLDILDKEFYEERTKKWAYSVGKEEIKKAVSENREKNGYNFFKRAEVAEVFDIPIKCLSDYFTPQEWECYLKKVKKDFCGRYTQEFPLGEILNARGIDITVIQDSEIPESGYCVKNNIKLNSQFMEYPYENDSVTNYLLTMQKNAYFIGVWATGGVKDWLYCNRDFVQRCFKFNEVKDERNIRYAREIKNTESVIIHVRRGDFVHLGMASSVDYVKKVICILRSNIKLSFYVFSDDIDWCKHNEIDLGLDGLGDRVVYVEGNSKNNSWIDLYLMSLGKILVPSCLSSFGYMALLLSNSIRLCVDAMKYKYCEGEIEFVKISEVAYGDVVGDNAEFEQYKQGYLNQVVERI